MAAVTGAQTPPTAFPGDWPGLGAFNNRQKQNGDPVTFNSGRTRPRWITPSTAAERVPLILDNTSFTNTAGLPGGPYDPPSTSTGFVSPPFPNSASWPGPSDISKEASSPYLMPRRAAIGPGNQIPRSPSYVFSTGTPMARSQNDPTVAQNPAARKYFEWVFTPPGGAERNYALYAWLPIGATDISAAGGAADRRFPQRFFVYEIRYGFDRDGDGLGDGRYIDVVDTEVSGNGFVRLGNGGAATDATFPFTGGNPIRVRLYNTVPRDGNGVLQVTGATSSSTDLTEANLASSVLVYADAMRASPVSGKIVASPTAATVVGGTTTTLAPTIDWNLTVARNLFTPASTNGVFAPSTNGTVISYQANPARWPIASKTTPLEKWRYSTIQESPNGNTVDNNSSAVSFSAGWTVRTTNPRHVGINYATAPGVVGPATASQTATYAPDLDDGTYDVYTYVAGDSGAELYLRAMRYQILEGTTVVFSGVLDESGQRGWIRLGDRRYTQDRTNAQLKVIFTNVSTNAGDASRLVYADAVRFVSGATIGISSSPVHATVAITPKGGGTPVDTKVVIVADESGKIHCLDLAGNGDGTTTEYWSYPSTPDYTDNSWADPNLVEGRDGTINPLITPARDNQPTAEMPTSFDLSTAAVARVTVAGVQHDFLYIGATNGRVYCIDMAGRGDFDGTSHKVGSAMRRWTYPNDYPQQAQSSALGSFRGSLVFGDVAQGAAKPTIYVPARQGRVLALDAVGTDITGGTTPSGGFTTVQWQFPAATNPTLPPIEMTPTLFKTTAGTGMLYFGTLRNPNDDGPGEFYALNASTGGVVWRINGSGLGDTAGVTIVHSSADLGPTFSDGFVEETGSFITGPVAVSGATLAAVPSPYTTTNVDTLYVLNENHYLYGLTADTGTLVTGGGFTYRTNDLDILCEGNLTYTVTQAYDRLGALRLFPMIVVPGSDGRLRMAFARVEDYNIGNGYLGDGLDFPGALRDAAAANNFLFTADDNGSVYAMDTYGSSAGNLPTDYDIGVNEIVPPNDPRGKPFRNLKLKLMNRAGYILLRDANADGTGKLTYNDAVVDPTNSYSAPNPAAGNPFAFEWGQTAYILVYGFPYATTNQATPPANVSPPQVRLSINVEGKGVRELSSDARQFMNPSSAPPVDEQPDAGGSYRQDGYAIIPFTFQNAGANSVPPGRGTITAGISTASLGTSGQPMEVIPIGAASHVDFYMANPIGLVISPNTASEQGIGYGPALLDPLNDQNKVNGSPDVGSTTAIESQIMASAGYGQHGGTQSARVYVYDRSLMALIRPGGIENLRVARTNLQREGGVAGMYRALAPGLYPNFEDQPVNFPNTSLDYPDIGREQVRAIKDPNGTAENPLLTTVGLKTPLNLDENNPLTRQPQPTPIDMVVDIPRYQPPVNVGAMTSQLSPTGGDYTGDLLHVRHDANKAVPPQGYFGRVWAYVDSTGDSRLNTDVREAYRSFNLAVGVLPQVTIQVGTPTVDLGSLAAGTGYAPSNPAAAPNGPFNPWSGSWSDAYKPISVRNDGNVNLLDLRVAKGYNEDNGYGDLPTPLTTSANDPLAWLSGALIDNAGKLAPGDLWSNIDTTFAAPNSRDLTNTRVILPKPRVTDRVPTELVANPYPRANPNTGMTGKDIASTHVNVNLPSTTPKVAVSVPIGFPVGNYSSQIRVIEDEYSYRAAADRTALPDNQVLDYFNKSNGYEAFSDPITLTFKVRETRMTNGQTPKTAPIIDPDLSPAVGGRTKYSFNNAAPAAMRDAFGSLVVAWESDRAVNAGTGGINTQNPSLIYLASLANNGIGANSTNAPSGNSPLWDLSQFVPATSTQWFKTATPTGYPNVTPALFPGGTIISSTTRFGSPSFPVAGQVDPLGAGIYKKSLMGFVGETQLQTATGRITQSRVYLATVSTDQLGNTTVSEPVLTQGDPQTTKGKPSVLQLQTGALVFYSETSAGQSSITVSRYSSSAGAFQPPVHLNFGDGFSSVFSPSATARQYRRGTAAPLVELSFAGKLRGRPNAEVYLGRLRMSAIGGEYQLVDSSGASVENTQAGSPFQLLPTQSLERLVNEGNGVYRSRGVLWSRQGNTAPALYQYYANGTAPLNLLVGTGAVERQSGLIAYDSRLGGKVYLDPELGTVRFVGGSPDRNADLRLTYTPTFLRVSAGGTAAYSAVNGVFDDHYTSEYEVLNNGTVVYPYWFKNSTTLAGPDDKVRNDRFFFAYGRGAQSRDAARPYSTTMRLGVRLPTRIATDANGNLIGLTVSGNTKPYQVDPANGRIYFQAEDEDRQVTINYTGVNEATNAPVAEPPIVASVSFVLERAESPILIDEAANESDLTAFADPFTYTSTQALRHERPPLYWLFYVSTRSGQPDVYFQTIAPRYLPFAK
jgi:hypothetical protein